MPTCPRLRTGQEPTGRSEGWGHWPEECPLATGIRLSDPPMAQPIPGRSSDAPHGKGAGSRSRCDSAQRARKPTAAPGLGEGSARAGARPDSGAPLSPGSRARAQAFTCFIFPSLGAGRRGQRALCAYLPPPSPAGLKAAAEGGFPRYYNNQPATARSDPLRRRPRPGAEDAGFRHVRLSSSPRRVGTGLCSPRKSWLPFPALSLSAAKRLTPNLELFRCVQQEGSLQGRCAGGEVCGAATADWQ